jgi:hypothetical protein
MKRFVFFLMALSLLLCSSNIYAHEATSISTSSNYFEVQKAASFDPATLAFYNTATSISHIKEPEPTILTMEDQNEDEDLVKKHLGLAKTFAAFTYAFLLHYSASSISENLPAPRDITEPATCKYIFQRVLRI